MIEEGKRIYNSGVYNLVGGQRPRVCSSLNFPIFELQYLVTVQCIHISAREKDRPTADLQWPRAGPGSDCPKNHGSADLQFNISVLTKPDLNLKTKHL
jgi:hypothetical protein